jgi:hypothetical protein
MTRGKDGAVVTQPRLPSEDARPGTYLLRARAEQSDGEKPRGGRVNDGGRHIKRTNWGKTFYKISSNARHRDELTTHP